MNQRSRSTQPFWMAFTSLQLHAVMNKLSHTHTYTTRTEALLVAPIAEWISIATAISTTTVLLSDCCCYIFFLFTKYHTIIITHSREFTYYILIYYSHQWTASAFVSCHSGCCKHLSSHIAADRISDAAAWAILLVAALHTDWLPALQYDSIVLVMLCLSLYSCFLAYCSWCVYMLPALFWWEPILLVGLGGVRVACVCVRDISSRNRLHRFQKNRSLVRPVD